MITQRYLRFRYLVGNTRAGFIGIEHYWCSFWAYLNFTLSSEVLHGSQPQDSKHTQGLCGGPWAPSNKWLLVLHGTTCSRNRVMIHSRVWHKRSQASKDQWLSVHTQTFHLKPRSMLGTFTLHCTHSNKPNDPVLKVNAGWGSRALSLKLKWKILPSELSTTQNISLETWKAISLHSFLFTVSQRKISLRIFVHQLICVFFKYFCFRIDSIEQKNDWTKVPPFLTSSWKHQRGSGVSRGEYTIFEMYAIKTFWWGMKNVVMVTLSFQFPLNSNWNWNGRVIFIAVWKIPALGDRGWYWHQYSTKTRWITEEGTAHLQDLQLQAVVPH